MDYIKTYLILIRGEKIMLKITVKYFLNQEGRSYFDEWYQTVFTITSLQDGFISLDRNKNHFIVYLCFENEEKLSHWSATEIHNSLSSEIETYFIQKPKINIEIC
jgi:hypothetical protein